MVADHRRLVENKTQKSASDGLLVVSRKNWLDFIFFSYYMKPAFVPRDLSIIRPREISKIVVVQLCDW